MSDAQREMTLQEWVDKLPPIHLARRQLDKQHAEIARLKSVVRGLVEAGDRWSRNPESIMHAKSLRTALDAARKEAGT